MTNRWSVAKRNGRWLVFDRDVPWDYFDDLAEAHTLATQNAVADCLYAEGGLTRLRWMRQITEDIEYLRRWKPTP